MSARRTARVALALIALAGSSRAGDGEPLRLPEVSETAADRVGPAPRIRAFRFEGNRALSDAQLRAALEPLRGRPLAPEELVSARDTVTRLYAAHGYVTSGAIVPDQIVDEGVVRISIVEGSPPRLSIDAPPRQAHALRRVLQQASSRPLDVARLEDALRRAQESPAIERLHAELAPGASPGSSVLRVRVDEGRPWALGLRVSDGHAPSVGATGAELLVRRHGLAAADDVLDVAVERSRGLDAIEIGYRLPIGARSELEASFRRSRSEVVERPFDVLDIESDYVAYRLGASHTLRRRPGSRMWIGLAGELRRGETFLLGDRFSFSPGPRDGVSRVSALRLLAGWTARRPSLAISARSRLSIGLDVLGATRVSKHATGSGIPDGSFVSWLGQLQLAARLPETLRSAVLHGRIDLQLTRDPLLSLERFAIGGPRTVRGYSTHELVRDNGVAASLELRVPLRRDVRGVPLLELAPFVDVGRAWNESRGAGPRTLASVGAGIHWRARPGLRLSLEAAKRLRRTHLERSGLRDHGLHAAASWDF